MKPTFKNGDWERMWSQGTIFLSFGDTVRGCLGTVHCPAPDPASDPFLMGLC